MNLQITQIDHFFATVENFMAWRNEFNIKRLQNKKAKKSEGKKTGKILILC